MRIFLILMGVIIGLIAEDFVVIANKNSPITTIGKSELKSIYLKKRRFWNETKLVALNLPPNNTLRQNFEKDILEMNPSQLETYWMKQHYSGHRPPYRLKSMKSVLLFVKKVKGAIGYIPYSLVSKDVKIIYRSSN